MVLVHKLNSKRRQKSTQTALFRAIEIYSLNSVMMEKG
jgi:hypothetical protein